MPQSKQSLAQFGQTIKAKHPEYADLGDEDLGRKVLAKYPQYADMVDSGPTKYDPAADAAAHAANPFSGASPHAPAPSFAPGDSPDWQTRLTGNDPTGSALAVAKHITSIPASIAHTVRHPYDSLIAPTVNSGKAAFDSARAGDYSAAGQHALDAIPVAGPWARAIENEAHDQGVLPALAGAGLDVAGAEALGGKAPGKALSSTADALQSTGKGIVHDTIGTLKRDVKRGADPAQAFFDERIGPTLSMNNIARKARMAKSEVGPQIPAAIDAATDSGTTVPAAKVYSAIRPPIDRLIETKMGPGGTGDIGNATAYARGFDGIRSDAGAGESMTPRDIYDVKRNIADNTSWSDPTMLDLKRVRQQNTGALGGILEDVVPGLDSLNSRYQNVTSLERRASERAANPASSSLTALTRAGKWGVLPVVGPAIHSVLDSVPVKTTAATALHGFGEGFDNLASGVDAIPARARRGAALIAPSRHRDGARASR